MADSQALAAAKEIDESLGISGDRPFADECDAEPTLEQHFAAEIISGHYAPKLEAAEKMEHALECVWSGVADRVRYGLDDYSTDTYTIIAPMLVGALKEIRAALAAWKATQ